MTQRRSERKGNKKTSPKKKAKPFQTADTNGVGEDNMDIFTRPADGANCASASNDTATKQRQRYSSRNPFIEDRSQHPT